MPGPVGCACGRHCAPRARKFGVELPTDPSVEGTMRTVGKEGGTGSQRHRDHTDTDRDRPHSIHLPRERLK